MSVWSQFTRGLLHSQLPTRTLALVVALGAGGLTLAPLLAGGLGCVNAVAGGVSVLLTLLRASAVVEVNRVELVGREVLERHAAAQAGALEVVHDVHEYLASVAVAVAPRLCLARGWRIPLLFIKANTLLRLQPTRAHKLLQLLVALLGALALKPSGGEEDLGTLDFLADQHLRHGDGRRSDGAEEELGNALAIVTGEGFESGEGLLLRHTWNTYDNTET